ncbi:MAG TPA: HipA domain-containing protein [Candidatus Paceibacterota bacterium]|nr:HipA domain-containing protein [Candidatus Paceibacterota bacterium]
MTQKDGGSLAFKYDEEYSEEQTPLSLSMPIQVPMHPNRSIRAYLEGLLPDNENALKALGKRFSESPNNPFALLKYIGRDVAGAVEIYPEGETPTSNSDDKELRRIYEGEIEDQLRGKIAEYQDGVVIIKNSGKISLAGAQPKIALHKSAKGEWFVPTDSHPSTHILKPLTEKLKNQDIVEHITLLAARKLGLNVCESEITSFNNLRVFIAKRYDRLLNQESGIYVRLHQEDFCQALSVAPTKKYQFEDGGPGVGEIARLISKFPVIENREAVGRAFFEGLVFNIYGRCPDAHAKNYSLILVNHEVRLAPLYDLTTGAPYGYTDNSAMRINSKYNFSTISEDDLLVEARRLRIDEDWASERIKFIRQNILSSFMEAGDSALKDVQNEESVVSVMVDIESMLTKPFA